MKAKTALLAGGLLIAIGTVAPAAATFHFALSRSAPAADAEITTLDEVRLWFTQAPQDNSVGIRVIDGAGNAVETDGPTRDHEEDNVFSARVERRLGAGAYTVAWRGIGDDGHVVRGEFGFTVTAQ